MSHKLLVASHQGNSMAVATGKGKRNNLNKHRGSHIPCAPLLIPKEFCLSKMILVEKSAGTFLDLYSVCFCQTGFPPNSRGLTVRKREVLRHISTLSCVQAIKPLLILRVVSYPFLSDASIIYNFPGSR